MNTNVFRVSLNERTREITLMDGKVLCFETDNDIVDFVLIVDGVSSIQYKIDVENRRGGVSVFNTISLKPDEQGKDCHILLQAGMLFNGKNTMQIRSIDNAQVRVSEKFDVWVKKPVLGYCDAYQLSHPLPSEFYQIERSLNELNDHPPKPSNDGYWSIWNTSIHEYEKSTVPFSGTSYIAGDGIGINNNLISVKTDGESIIFNEQGKLAFNRVDLGTI